MTTKNKQRVTLFLNPNLLKQAKMQAIVESRSLTALVGKAIINYLPKETIIKRGEIINGGVKNRKAVNKYGRNYKRDYNCKGR
jgi:uncharacterized membrane protein (UPF0182 family)